MRINDGMWRFSDLLPISDHSNIVSLGEGNTPTIDLSDTLGAKLGLGRLTLKAEDRNPTGSFKARVASVAASIVRERGLSGMVGTSSGNGGAAAAAYAAAAGSRAVLFTLTDTVTMKLAEITSTGGTAYRVEGVGHDAGSTKKVADLIAQAATDAGFYPMLTGFHYAPEAMQGIETIAFELAEENPETTIVYAPVGGGGLITGLHKGFCRLGLPSTPRIAGVHPRGATALPLALTGNVNGMTEAVTTSVSGLQMAILYDTLGAVEAIEGSGGHACTVSDPEIWDAQRLLAHEHGILLEPAGATALAGVIKDARQGLLDREDSVSVILTGAGYKDSSALIRLSGEANVPVVDLLADASILERVLGEIR